MRNKEALTDCITKQTYRDPHMHCILKDERKNVNGNKIKGFRPRPRSKILNLHASAAVCI